MNRDFVWLVGLLALIAVASGGYVQWKKASVQPALALTQHDRDAASALFASIPQQGPDNVLRLRFYDALRDRMDAQEYGTLEALAEALRKAPRQRVQPGCDLTTFYSAVGGDLAFRGGGQEDWQRLIAFDEAWDKATHTSTPCYARAQALLGAAQAQGGSERSRADAMAALHEGTKREPGSAEDPYVSVLIDRLHAPGMATGH